MSKTLTIFSYKGSVGANSDLENGKFINDINGSGQMGVVVAVENVVITSEALDLMKTNFRREGGSFASTMVTRSETDDYPSSIAVMGFGMHGVAICTQVEYSRDCDLTVLDEIEVDDKIIVPEDFIAFIDEESNT